MADDKIDINEFFPSIPNVAEEFIKKYHGEKHTKEEWWELFSDFLDEEVFEDLCSDEEEDDGWDIDIDLDDDSNP